MAKYKLKTKKSISKRVRFTATGKMKIRQTNRAHHAYYRTTKQKRQLRGNKMLASNTTKAWKKAIHGTIGGKK